MTDTQKNILVLVVIAIIFLFIIVFRKTIGKWFGFTSTPADGTFCKNGILPGVYKNGKCVSPEIITTILPGGLTPPEGSACTTSSGAAGTIQNKVCVATPPAEGSACTMPDGTTAGTIQSGVCVANNPNIPPNIILKGYKLQGQNTAGAKAYQYSNGQFTATNTILGYQTQIISDAYVTVPKLYYRTNSGWFDGADMAIIQIL